MIVHPHIILLHVMVLVAATVFRELPVLELPWGHIIL